MKSVVFLVVLFFQIAVAQTPEELFLKGNNLYQTEQYQDAINTYKTIEKKAYKSADLYYNIANAYYKLNKIAPAIYNYEKALKLDSQHKQAQINLKFANRMKIDAIPQIPKTFLQKVSESTYLKWSYKTWSILAVIASFLTTLLFLLYYFSFSSKKKIFYFNSTIFAALLLLASVIFAFKNHQITSNKKEAIVFSQKSTLKNAPTNSSETLLELHEGTKVKILKKGDYWTKIKLADGKTGWISTATVKEI